MSDRNGCGAFAGSASGTQVRPPSLEAAMSLTVVMLLLHEMTPFLASCAAAAAAMAASLRAIA